MASETHEEEEYFPSFPSKLFHMVENVKYNGIIWWTENGDGFFICKEREFVKSDILDRYKVKSYGSFTRQLGKYGFHKKRRPTQERANGPSSYYCHDEGYFKRGCKDLLVNIIKKENQGTKKETSSKAEPEQMLNLRGIHKDLSQETETPPCFENDRNEAWSQSSFLLAQNVTGTSTFPKGDAARHLMADGGAPSVSCVGQSSVSQEGQMQFSGECTSTQSTMLESNDYQSIHEAVSALDGNNPHYQYDPMDALNLYDLKGFDFFDMDKESPFDLKDVRDVLPEDLTTSDQLVSHQSTTTEVTPQFPITTPDASGGETDRGYSSAGGSSQGQIVQEVATCSIHDNRNSCEIPALAAAASKKPATDNLVHEGNSSQEQEVNFKAKLQVNPNCGPLKGGGPFSLQSDKLLPETAWAFFGDSPAVAIGKTVVDPEKLFGTTPCGNKPGPVPVKIFDTNKVYLGEDTYTYYETEPTKKRKKQCLPSRKRKHEEIKEVIRKTIQDSLKQLKRESKEERNETDPQQGPANQELRPADILKPLVYAGAQAGASELIEIIFNLPMAKIIFETYKNESCLPEDIAEENGHKEIAHFLRGITKRYCKANGRSPGQPEVIDWLALSKALEEIEFDQSETSSDTDDSKQMCKDVVQTRYSDDCSKGDRFLWKDLSSSFSRSSFEPRGFWKALELDDVASIYLADTKMITELEKDDVSDFLYFGDTEVSSHESDNSAKEGTEFPLDQKKGMEPSKSHILWALMLGITDNLRVRRIVEQLFADGVFSESDKDEILAETSICRRCCLLMDKLPRTGPDAFERLLQALRLSGLGFLADNIAVFLEAKALVPSRLELREYQKELAEPAIQGKNTIICAPTNSGKTFVAIEIAKKHLERLNSDYEQLASRNTNIKKGRVVFIGRTVNHVLQQKERFEYFLSYKYPVGEISGASSTDFPLKYLLQSYNVVVTTAQVLVNALNSKYKEERVELKDISLLLFDECHHAHKEHPYNKIMERYLALKSQPGYQHCLPQIVGLTASFGTGKAPSRDRVEEHIILVSANLDAETISTVRKNQTELKKYANIPERATHHVEKKKHDPFEKIIYKVMTAIEARIKKLEGKSFKAVPSDKGGQQYRQWVEEFYKDAVAVGDRYLVTYVEHLREYHISLTVNSNTRIKNGQRYLQTYFASLDREKFTPIDENLEKLFQKAMEALDKFIERNGEPENPKLAKLKELLLENYKGLQLSDNGKQIKARKNRNGSETIEDWADDNGPKKGGNKQDAMNGDVEAFKLADDNGTGATKSKGEKAGNKSCQEENAVKDDDKTENISLKTKQFGSDTTENSFHVISNQNNKPEESDNGILCVHEADTAEASPSDVTVVQSDLPDVSDSEEKDDRKDVITEGSSFDKAKKEDKPEQTEAGRHPEWDGPKGILFTSTREATEALLDWIKETKELNAVLRPALLVGSGDGTFGMTEYEQERVVKRFKTGEKNLLLATSVADEGVDISDCNYVIRYDMMGNEISSVQARGRVRAEYGKYSVLVGHSGTRKRDRISEFREILMTEALNKIQIMDPETFKKKVIDMQQKSYRDRSLKKHIYALSKSKQFRDDVSFLCRKCKEFVCQTHDVRCIQGIHHVIINNDVRNTKVDIKNHPSPKKIDDIEMNKKIFCKNCGEDWGVTALISGVEWMCIKICSFILEFPGKDQPRRMYKKWKDLPFGIKEASVEEILKQSGDKGPGDDLLDFNFNI